MHGLKGAQPFIQEEVLCMHLRASNAAWHEAPPSYGMPFKHASAYGRRYRRCSKVL